MNRIAVIVIGSNSTRSLCCDETPALSHPMRGRVETRLLLHLNKENPMLTDEAIALLAGGVSQLYEQIQYESARLVGLYATSAVRDAQNAQALSATLESLCGQPLRVLSGREEAAYSFYGAAGDWPRAGMIDIGGGSTEIALGSGDTLAHAYSLQLGASRLHKRQPINHGAQHCRRNRRAPACPATRNRASSFLPGRRHRHIRGADIGRADRPRGYRGHAFGTSGG